MSFVVDLIKQNKSLPDEIINNLSIEIIKYIQNLEEKYKNEENFFKDEKILLNFKVEIVRFINELLNKNNLTVWDLRELAIQISNKLSVDFDQHVFKNFVFLEVLETISEKLPTPAPLLIKHKDDYLIKKPSIILDFPEIIEDIQSFYSQLDEEKKHILLFEIFSDGELLNKGTYYHLSVLESLVYILMDKVIYEEILPIENLISTKQNEIKPIAKNYKFLVEIVFNSLYEFYTKEKQKPIKSINKDLAKFQVKVKKYIALLLQDMDELNYLLEAAKEDERLYKNSKDFILQVENQVNTFKKAKEMKNNEKDVIDGVLWFIGIKNIDVELFFKHFNINTFIDFINQLQKDIETGKEHFKEGLKDFLERMLSIPSLFFDIKDLDKLENIINSYAPDLYEDYLFFSQRYKEYLEQDISINPQNDIKKLYAKYKTGQIDKQEFKNWLKLFENNKDINKTLLEFVRNG